MIPDTRFILQEDLEYPHSKHDEHNDLPFCVERERFNGSKSGATISPDIFYFFISLKDLRSFGGFLFPFYMKIQFNLVILNVIRYLLSNLINAVKPMQ